MAISDSACILQTFAMIVKQLPKLENLILSDTPTDHSVLKAISEHSLKLRWLEISRCMGINDAGIRLVANKYTELVRLDPPHCPFVTAWKLIKKINGKNGWEVDGESDSNSDSTASSDISDNLW